MRTLKYAILGLLSQGEMTGYELMKQFESALCEFWSAKHSQIYPELKKLAEEGSVTFVVEDTGAVLEKKHYNITPAGRADLMAWLAADTELEPTPKDVARLKIFFSAYLTQEQRLHLLQDQLHRHRARLAHLQRNSEKFAAVPPAETDAFGDYLVLMGAVMREQSTCDWLEKCIALCK